MYNGAAPSVPPRHLNNGIPSRESTIKRLEQQQLKIAQKNEGGHQLSQIYQAGCHTINEQSSVSRVPTTIQRQHSLDIGLSDVPSGGHPQKQVFTQQKLYSSLENKGPNERVQPYHSTIPEEVGPLSLVERPIGMFVDNNRPQVEDSPQRFLRQFSRSVVSSHPVNSNTQTQTPSRIPHLGPISSAIFGNTRDSRSVHEILDPGEKTLEDKLLNMNETQRIEFLRTNHPELLKEYRNRTINMQQLANQNIRSSTANNPRYLSNQSNTISILSNHKESLFAHHSDPREAVIRLSNGKSVSQVYSPVAITNDIANRPVVDPSIRFQQTPPNSIGKNSTSHRSSLKQNHVLQTSKMDPVYSDRPPNYREAITLSAENPFASVRSHPGMTENMEESFSTLKRSDNETSHDIKGQHYPKKSSGLKWISLNENGSDMASSLSPSTQTSNLLKHVEGKTVVETLDQSKPQILKQTVSPPTAASVRRTVSSTLNENTSSTSSQGMPVPLASKFNPTQGSRKASLSGRIFDLMTNFK